MHDVATSIIAAAGSIVAAVLGGLAARSGRRNRRLMTTIRTQLDRVEERTSTELDGRIEEAVRRTLRDSPETVTGAVIAEALRDLLEGIIEAAGKGA